MSGPTQPIDAALFDAETAASDDFYRHVNGGWLDANPVPAEYGAWGAGHVVHERNQEILHRLLEEAAGREDPKGSAGQKVGDYFAAREPIDGFTPEQRFFVSWATVWRTNYTDEYLHLIVKSDPHSLARARVNEPLANLPAFAAAFGIGDGSPMARDADGRADIW